VALAVVADRRERAERQMRKVTVYKVKCFDAVRGETRILRHMATRSGAKMLGDEFEIIEGSGIEIDASQLGYVGEYMA
jgi:hypothetical protein